MWWARNTRELDLIAGKWIASWLKDPGKIIRLLSNKYRTNAGKIKKIKIVDIENKTTKNLLAAYQRSFDIFYDHILIAEYASDIFDDYFEASFKQFIEDECKAKMTYNDWLDLLRPNYISKAQEYEYSLWRMAGKSASLRQINNLVEKYFWIRMTWDGQNTLTKKEIAGDLRCIRDKHEKHKISQMIRDIQCQSKLVLKNRRQLIKKYKLPSQTASYLKLLDAFCRIHDERKEIQMRCNDVMLRVLVKIAGRQKIAYADALWYFYWELDDLACGKELPKKNILDRKNGITIMMKRGYSKIYFGKIATQLLNNYVLRSKTQRKTMINGVIANPGKKFMGKVFLAKSGIDACRRMKKDRILVTSMTTVDYLPAMKRARAIITDDGGITCHAAIISRELKIPCIVGTKIATQVLKDGDLVEVDADKGIVKKIKRTKIKGLKD